MTISNVYYCRGRTTWPRIALERQKAPKTFRRGVVGGRGERAKWGLFGLPDATRLVKREIEPALPQETNKT